MLRPVLKLSLLLIVLLALPIILIRAQPYDDSELRAFLTPSEGCPAPCFMGIRPGVTTTEEAIAILEAHPSLANTIELNLPDGIRLRAIDPQSPTSDSTSGYLSIENNIIQWLRIQTDISLWELWAIYGQPDWATSAFPGGGANQEIFYAIGYDQYLVSFSFTIPIECWPNKLEYLLQQKVTFLLGADFQDDTPVRPILRLFACDETLF
jgi:hypothetical protein